MKKKIKDCTCRDFKRCEGCPFEFNDELCELIPTNKSKFILALESFRERYLEDEVDVTEE